MKGNSYEPDADDEFLILTSRSERESFLTSRAFWLEVCVRWEIHTMQQANIILSYCCCCCSCCCCCCRCCCCCCCCCCCSCCCCCCYCCCSCRSECLTLRYEPDHHKQVAPAAAVAAAVVIFAVAAAAVVAVTLLLLSLLPWEHHRQHSLFYTRTKFYHTFLQLIKKSLKAK